MKATDIESISIHPAIGIARVGNAENDWFLAAEVRGGVPKPEGGFRATDGKIKRQVPRFRLYARLKSGEVREITADDGEIEWEVEVANVKAGWYQFDFAMDLDASYVIHPERRNAHVETKDRHKLCILPEAKRISGRNQDGAQYHFDKGKFYDKEIYLGELRTDDKGRLLFLGGLGKSGSQIKDKKPVTFANNDDFHDDVCDGPVRATFTVDGQEFTADPAHVVVTPPNFGPGLFGVITMDDVLQDVYADWGWIDAPTETQFTRDIWPILERQTAHQWVNDGFMLLSGQGTPLDANDPKMRELMADNSAKAEPYRKAVLKLFRPQPVKKDFPALPSFYGDTYGDKVDETLEYLTVTPTQYRHLTNWAEGNFKADWKGVPKLPVFDDLSPEEQIEELDRAGMVECLGGPFHPGIEVTWPMRLQSMWEKPYRLKSSPAGEPIKLDFGDKLSRKECLDPENGPNASSGPGSLTRWMGVPWQTDEASCNSSAVYTPSQYLSSPSFWGARVPNQVLPMEAYEIATMPGLSDLQRQRHFSNRRQWLRDIEGTDYQDRINNMVSEWWMLGIVEAHETDPELGLPAVCFVETGRHHVYTNGDFTLVIAKAAAALEAEADADGTVTMSTVNEKVIEPIEGPHPEPTYRRYERGEV